MKLDEIPKPQIVLDRAYAKMVPLQNIILIDPKVTCDIGFKDSAQIRMLPA